MAASDEARRRSAKYTVERRAWFDKVKTPGRSKRTNARSKLQRRRPPQFTKRSSQAYQDEQNSFKCLRSDEEGRRPARQSIFSSISPAKKDQAREAAGKPHWQRSKVVWIATIPNDVKRHPGDRRAPPIRRTSVLEISAFSRIGAAAERTGRRRQVSTSSSSTDRSGRFVAWPAVTVLKMSDRRKTCDDFYAALAARARRSKGFGHRPNQAHVRRSTSRKSQADAARRSDAIKRLDDQRRQLLARKAKCDFLVTITAFGKRGRPPCPRHALQRTTSSRLLFATPIRSANDDVRRREGRLKRP